MGLSPHRFFFGFLGGADVFNFVLFGWWWFYFQFIGFFIGCLGGCVVIFVQHLFIHSFTQFFVVYCGEV